MGRRVLAIVLAALVVGVPAAAWSAQPTAAPGQQPSGEKAEPKKPSAVRTYLVNRLKDFADIFSVKVSLGDSGSFLAHARLTRLAQIGAGRFCGTKVGFDGSCAGLWGEGRADYGLSVFYWASIGRKTSEASINKEAAKRNWFFSKVKDIKDSSLWREYYDANRPWYTIGGAFSVPFLPGLDVSMNPAEAVDFVLSLFAIPGFRVPPPFQRVERAGERVPMPHSIRWHGQEQFESYD